MNETSTLPSFWLCAFVNVFILVIPRDAHGGPKMILFHDRKHAVQWIESLRGTLSAGVMAELERDIWGSVPDFPWEGSKENYVVPPSLVESIFGALRGGAVVLADPEAAQRHELDGRLIAIAPANATGDEPLLLVFLDGAQDANAVIIGDRPNAALLLEQMRPFLHSREVAELVARIAALPPKALWKPYFFEGALASILLLGSLPTRAVPVAEPMKTTAPSYEA